MVKIFAPLPAALLALARSAEVYAVVKAIEFAEKNNIKIPMSK